MISFRYHIVSLVAVFLAVALGIVIGTTALNGPITKDLRNQVKDLQQNQTSLTQKANNLQAQADEGEEFAATYGGQIINGAL
ncbi:MAG: copper transporter, partial [Actinomycetia bacterium]|nr:copper transporter [Actinomycetes bacterium]